MLNMFCRHKKFYIEKDRQYFTLNDLIESYKQKHEVSKNRMLLISNPQLIPRLN